MIGAPDKPTAEQIAAATSANTGWLLEGDCAIRHQTYRDLLGEEKPSLRKKIAKDGWGSRFLRLRQTDGHWGRGFYQPKWTCTHYTLLDLKTLGLDQRNGPARDAVNIVLRSQKGIDGGINPSVSIAVSDVCINGMALNYCCYFGANEIHLKSVVDFLLSQRMADGGFNCRSNRGGAHHSSLHTTLSVIEGILEYERNGYSYRLNELTAARKSSEGFILKHRLFRSDKTGEVINSAFLRLYFPTRWYYDVLRALDYFRDAGTPYDDRMDDALAVIFIKKTPAGRWPSSRHPGATHFDMEKPGAASRWNTLRALRVLNHFIRPGNC